MTFLNPAAEALTGWPLADAVGRPLAEVFRIVNEQTRQPVEDPAAKVLRLGTVVGLANHTALLARDGRETPIDDCGAPIIDDRGGIAGVVLVFRDVTQRRRAEEAEVLRRANEVLRASEARFRALVQNSSDIISLFDAEGTVVYQSPSIERLLGYRPEDRIGHNVFRDPIVHPDDLDGQAGVLRDDPGPPRGAGHGRVPLAARRRLVAGHRGHRPELPARPELSPGSSPTTATSPSASGPRRRCARASGGSASSWTTPPTRSSCTTRTTTCAYWT